jgi:4'-phosphopantetheinyl transferase EntD
MFSLKMATFCKSANCPASQRLLAFVDAEIQSKERERIEAHLGACEFCAAEVEFYAHYPQADEPVAKAEIPLPLYELAEALLGNKHKEFFTLNKLLCETKA